MLKLYEIPQGSKIKTEIINTETDERRIDTITFHKLDGAYSYCTTSDGSVVHFSASTPLVRKDSYYEIWTPEPPPTLGKHCEPDAFDGNCQVHHIPVEKCWSVGSRLTSKGEEES